MCMHLEIHYFRFRPQCRRFRPRSRLTSSSNSSSPVRDLFLKKFALLRSHFAGNAMHAGRKSDQILVTFAVFDVGLNILSITKL